jgi:hypothetical protein
MHLSWRRLLVIILRLRALRQSLSTFQMTIFPTTEAASRLSTKLYRGACTSRGEPCIVWARTVIARYSEKASRYIRSIIMAGAISPAAHTRTKLYD